MGRTAFLIAATLAASGAIAEEKAAPASPQGQYPSGILSHGDSGDVMEDFFGGRVEREPSAEPGGANKRDPAIRWDGPAKSR